MAKQERIHRPHFLSKQHPAKQNPIREILELLTDCDDEIILKTLALTDWSVIPDRLVCRLLAPLAFNDNAEIRQTTALQLSSLGPSLTDSLADFALKLLANDSNEDVRLAVRRGSGLTENLESETTPFSENLTVEQDGQKFLLSYSAADSEQLADLKAFVTSWRMWRMTDKTNPTKTNDKRESTENDTHLPDAILDESEEEIVDLPRIGIPADVLNVTKATIRLPDVLIGDQ